jgi:hypothetical protein
MPAAAKAVKAKATPGEGAVLSAQGKDLSEDDEETELDLSDLTLDMDVETTRSPETAGEGDLTEADLENLLQETSDEEITFELSSDEERDQGGREEEVADAELEALLQEATKIRKDEVKAGEEAPETFFELKEVLIEEEKSSLAKIEGAGDAFEETLVVKEALIEEQASSASRIGTEKPLEPERLVPKETAPEEPSAEMPIGISEERLEVIITKVVQDVVERVARQTMASVAERVIGQAIEALKVSLENSSEES